MGASQPWRWALVTTMFESEGKWLSALQDSSKILFLASLSHELIIAGRSSYEVQSNRLEKPKQLRRINEIQHRVSAYMLQLLVGKPNIEFPQSIARLVLDQKDINFQKLMSWTWQFTKDRIDHAG